MAKVKFVYPVESMSGKVEDGQYFACKNGKTFLATYDVEKAKSHNSTESQLAAQGKFTEAAVQARTLLADNAKKAKLQELFVLAGRPGTLFGWVFKKIYAGESLALE